MFIGILQFELVIRGSNSLKDKRRVVKSLKDRLHRHHMVSVAEIAAHDHHRLAVLGLSVTSGSAAVAGEVLDRVLAKLRTLRDAELGEYSREIISGDQPPAGSADSDRLDLWTESERRVGGAGSREDAA